MTALRLYYMIDEYIGPYAGTERQLFILIQGMVARGHDVRLFVLRHTNYTRNAHNFPCSIESLEVGSIASTRSLRNLIDFRKTILDHRPDVVHAFFNDCSMLAPIFAKHRNCRIFTSRRDMGFWYTVPKLILLQIANALVDGIICNSYAVAKLVNRKEHVPFSKLPVIYNGLPMDDIEAPSNAEPVHAEAALSQKPTNVNVCLLANLRPIKKIEHLIQAAANVILEVPDCKFWIVGASSDIGYAAFLQGLVDQLGLSDVVQFLGRSDDPSQILRMCQIGVLTSESEGLSNALLEYMREGLPIVSSDVGGNSEVVRHNHTGFLYPYGNIDALSRCLVALCMNPKLRGRLANSTRSRAKDFSASSLVTRHLQIYTAGCVPLHLL